MKTMKYIFMMILFMAGPVCDAQERRDWLTEADSLLVEGKVEQAREAIAQYRLEAEAERLEREEEVLAEQRTDTAFYIVFFTAFMIMVIAVAREMGIWQKEKFEKQLILVEDEKERLEELLQKAGAASENVPAMHVLRDRLDILNKFLTASITENPAEYKNLNKEVSQLIANRHEFIGSTRMAFAESHPKFIARLSECGLTEWEINYCCLYALGLRGKEIGDYIQMKSHFNQSLAIRRKLGIEGMKLNTYIAQLLQEA